MFPQVVQKIREHKLGRIGARSRILTLRKLNKFTKKNSFILRAMGKTTRDATKAGAIKAVQKRHRQGLIVKELIGKKK